MVAWYTVDGFIVVGTNCRAFKKMTHSCGSKFVVILFLFSLFIQKITISWVLEFVDRTLHEHHENWYPTKFKLSTVYDTTPPLTDIWTEWWRVIFGRIVAWYIWHNPAFDIYLDGLCHTAVRPNIRQGGLCQTYQVTVRQHVRHKRGCVRYTTPRSIQYPSKAGLCQLYHTAIRPNIRQSRGCVSYATLLSVQISVKG